MIEEIQLFEAAQPVDSLTISHSKVRGREWDVSHLFRGIAQGMASSACENGCIMSSAALEVLWLV